ncbi:hypothetical protein BH23ACT12_BH23ACT12_02270 [soil metagenome]
MLAGLGPLLILGAALLFGLDVGEDLIFFGGTIAIAFIGAFLVWQFGTWSKIVGILAALLVGMALFWTAFGLGQPASFFDFLPGVLVLPGALLAIGCCVAALLAKRKGKVGVEPDAGERRVVRAVLAIVLLAAVVSGGLNLFTRSTASAGDAQARVALRDYEFSEDEYRVAGGSRVFIDNQDPFFHTFTVEGLDIDQDFVGGSSKVIDIPKKPGTYVVYCKPHTSDPEKPSEDDMASSITVT